MGTLQREGTAPHPAQTAKLWLHHSGSGKRAGHEGWDMVRGRRSRELWGLVELCK